MSVVLDSPGRSPFPTAPVDTGRARETGNPDRARVAAP
jgi:hypothetical protein